MFTQNPTNSKIAEKLKILHKRNQDVLIQIHYLKNTLLSENEYLAKLCTNPAFDQAIKLLNKKFPNVEIKANKAILEPLMALHIKLLHELQFHYNTLVDVLEIKDSLIDLLGQISAFQYILDIKLNTGMTRLYLDLVVDYACIMMILSSIPQIKLILVLYNLSFMCKFDQDDRLYLRLCERLVEKHKDGCVIELYNEINPYSRTLLGALASVGDLLASKLSSTNEWDETEYFKLSKTRNIELYHLLPLEKIHRWLFFGNLILYTEILRSTVNTQMFRSVLEVAATITLFRDELLVIQPFMSKFCSSQKGLSKLATLVKDSQKDLCPRTLILHRSRRNYLRLVMRHQLQVLLDQPGIIAPNFGVLSLTIASASDELHWLITHVDQPISKKSGSKEIEWSDPQLPEFLYQAEEIRHLLQQFEIVSSYYKKMLLEHDVPALQTLIDTCLPHFTDCHLATLNFLIDKINLLDEQQPLIRNSLLPLEEKPFKSVRLDWLRLQTLLSFQDSAVPWDISVKLIILVNKIILHTHLVDNLPHFLDKFSSSKFLFFHQTIMKDLFESNLKLAAQHRYSIIFPRLCSQFLANGTQNCPEDFNRVLRSSTEMAHIFLSRICQEVCQLMASIIKSHFELSQKSLATNAIDLYHYHFQKRQKDTTDGHKRTTNVVFDFNQLPGSESRRTNVEISSSFDLELATLSQLAVCLNSRSIIVNNRILDPTMYLKKEIMKFLNDKLVSLANIKFKIDKHEVVYGARRASEMKTLITECLSAITRISEYVNINVSLIFMDVFLSQSLSKDPMGRSTLTDVYCAWYLDIVLKQPYILHSPLLKCFLTIHPHNQKEAANILINCEEFTDIYELRALVEVIGPFGMRILNERIIQAIIKNINVLRRFVNRNRSILMELNVLNLDYVKIKKLLHDIEDVEEFCQNWKQMGILFGFKGLCREAVKDVVKKSVPFLKATVDDLQQDIDTEQIDHLSSVSESESTIHSGFRNQLIVNELCQGFGLKTKMDSTLFNGLESLKIQQQEIQMVQQEDVLQKEDLQNELLIVATSYLLPRLVGSNFYHIEYEALDESVHCTAYAIKELMYAFFSRYGEERLDEETRKFIGLTSSNLLRLGLEINNNSQSNKEEITLINNRDSIYIFFDFVIQTLENVSDDFYEECFPYALVRQAYHNVVKQSRQIMTNAAHPTEASSKAALEASKIDVK